MIGGTSPRRLTRGAPPILSNTSIASTVGSVSSVPVPKKNIISKNKKPRSRNHTANSMPAVHIKTHDMLNPQERKFLEAAEKGDRPTLIACLKQVILLKHL